MYRTQIQLPDTLYREVKRIAQQQEWSVTEVIRQAAETMVRLYPPTKLPSQNGYRLPPPIMARLRVADPVALKTLLLNDQEHGT